MKKLILLLVTILMLSCAPKTVDNYIPITVKTEYTLDESICNSELLLNDQHELTWQQQASKNSEQILKNQIVIMREIKNLKK